MNDIIQNLEANATNGKENFCYISEKQLNAMKELSKREAKENKQIKEIYKELFNTYQKLKKENEEVTSLNLHQVDKIQQLKEQLLVAHTNEETFRLEMKDITQTLGLDENTLFDDVKAYVRSLKDNWNKLKEYIYNQIPTDKTVLTKHIKIFEVLDKMQELERSDNQ